MGRCFVIQPFDKGVFDKRYADVFVPAIKKVGLEPYRVDLDPSSIIPIETIEKGLRESEACLAEITTDNPNVWFELGFAIASNKNPVLVCSKDRPTKFPFDIQHRNIIQYASESPRDFKELEDKISSHLEALLTKDRELKTITSLSPVKQTEGLSPHEIAALVVVMQDRLTPNSTTTPYEIKNNMTKFGYTPVAVSLTVESLIRKKMIQVTLVMSEDGEQYEAYSITPDGVEWLLAHQDKLILRNEKQQDEDVPF